MPTTAEVLQTGSLANVYKGTAFATIGTDSYLYSANFRAGTIDVLKGNPASLNLTGNFIDPTLPAGYAPFDIRQLNGLLYVTYALQDGTKHDELDGPGRGFVSVFDLQGKFLGRIASDGTLDAPWGLAIAPTSFGFFGGDLLVGNFGDGTISAFKINQTDPTNITSTLDGQLHNLDGSLLTIDGLWALTVGNNGSGGSSQKLYFTAGPNDESAGAFGIIDPVPEPSTLAMFGFGLLGLGFMMRRRALASQ